ncbi:MAG: HEAT repeat domain-containing protein [Chlamydiae bacterium]|nr:HEAT repeat domain-containing protein [Chlamydiota bacterium]
MNLYPFLQKIIDIAKFEFLLVIVVILLLFFARIILTIKQKREEKLKKTITNLLLEAIEKEKITVVKHIPQKCLKPKMLLSVLENLDSKFSDKVWVNIKEQLVKNNLSPLAKKWVKSSNWMKRNFAARCFALAPQIENESEIIHLLGGPIPLVRLTAIEPAVYLGTNALLHAFFQAMSKEPERGRYPYRDAILKGQTFVFSWIKEQLIQEKDTKLRYIYLDILSAKFDSFVLKFIKKDLRSSHKDLRLKAVTVVASFPNEKSVSLILSLINDPNPLIRAEVVKALPSFLNARAIPKLKKALLDKDWWVRLYAALALKKLGVKGRKILLSQDKKKHLKSYEVAQYVLALGEI